MQTIAYHQAALRRTRSNPDLKRRVVQRLETLHQAQPAAVWERWRALLDKPEGEALAELCAKTEDGKALRDTSPITAVLYPAERAMVWRCVGWWIFLRRYGQAAADLGLDVHEQAAITGIAPPIVGGWTAVTADATGGETHTFPEWLEEERLQGLRQVIGVQHALALLLSSPAERRRWLETEDPDLGAAPLELLCQGKGAVVCECLTCLVRSRLHRMDLPRW